ncbi:MAG TPA: zf-HC2 domain-containing protein [Jatrophihabitantaceae bacterium]|nr:zf-HC2 domain-containing protein [Jatrophihabitantaceae bacterium]
MSRSDPFEMFDGAYVLGALSDDDRRAYEAHLLECDACAASVRELQDLPQALALVSPAALEDDPPPSSLLPSLQRRVRRDRNRRRWIVGSVAAAAAACIVAVAVVATRPDSPSSHPVAMQAVGAGTAIKATIDVRPVAWGTRIDLVCIYNRNVKAGHPYALLVIDRDGGQHQLGTWNLAPGKEAKYESGTSLKRSDIASVQITGADYKTPVLTLNL